MSAHVSDSFQCSEVIEVSIHAPERSYFSKEKLRFQRLVSTTGMTLGFQCPKISTLKVIGVVEGSKVYEGYSKKDQRWMLVQGTQQTPKPVVLNEGSQAAIKKRKIGIPKVQNTKSTHRKQIGPYTVIASYRWVVPQGTMF